MMEEAGELGDYPPISFKAPSERDYVSFLWESFETNYANGKFQFAFLAYHMLLMSFVYFNIWQIKRAWPESFEKSLIGFGRDIENELINATSPFALSAVRERTVMRFLKLVGSDNSEIGVYAKLVDDRNEVAHANGNIFFKDQVALDRKIADVLRAVNKIQAHSHSTIENCYQEFLCQSHRSSSNVNMLILGTRSVQAVIHDIYMSVEGRPVLRGLRRFRNASPRSNSMRSSHRMSWLSAWSTVS